MFDFGEYIIDRFGRIYARHTRLTSISGQCLTHLIFLIFLGSYYYMYIISFIFCIKKRSNYIINVLTFVFSGRNTRTSTVASFPPPNTEQSFFEIQNKDSSELTLIVYQSNFKYIRQVLGRIMQAGTV